MKVFFIMLHPVDKVQISDLYSTSENIKVYKNLAVRRDGQPIKLFTGRKRQPNSVKRFFFASKLFGLFPVNSKFDFTFSLTCYSIAFCLVMTIVTLGYKTYYLVESNDFEDDKAWQKIIYYSRAIVENAIVISHVAQVTIHKRFFSDVLKEVNNCAQKSSYAQYFAPIGYAIIAANFLIQAMLESTSDSSSAASLASAVSEVFCIAILVQFCVILEVFKEEIHNLTDHICLNQAKLEILADRRQKILELADSTNKVFSVQLLLLCFKLFTDVIYFAYFTIVNIRLLTTSKGNLIMVTRMPLYAIWQLFELYSISSSTEMLIESAENFNAELFQLMRDNKELCKNRKLSLCLSLKKTVSFTACGFFTLGYPLVTSVIAAATTYLVILVQFSM